jgi:hypothetical protein
MAIEDLNELGDKDKASQLSESFEKHFQESAKFEENYNQSNFLKVEKLENEYYDEKEKIDKMKYDIPKFKIKKLFIPFVFAWIVAAFGLILMSAFVIPGLVLLLLGTGFLIFIQVTNKKEFKQTIKILDTDFQNQKSNAIEVFNNHLYLRELEDLKQKHKEFFEYKEFIEKHFSKFNEKWVVNLQLGL